MRIQHGERSTGHKRHHRDQVDRAKSENKNFTEKTENVSARSRLPTHDSNQQEDAPPRDTSGKSPFSSAHYSHEPAEGHKARAGSDHAPADVPRVRPRNGL